MYGLKANTRKLMINSFANGELDLVRKFYAKYGNDIFEKAFHGHQRLVFYALKNGHFNIIKLYIDLVNGANFSTHEIHMVSREIASAKRFKKWLDGYDAFEYKSRIIAPELLATTITTHIVGTYDIELIDQFLERYPNKFNELVKSIGTSAKGTQLRRHLKLRELL